MIKRVAIFTNPYELSKKVEEELTKKLAIQGINVVKTDELRQNDLVIAIGGDGAFLNMVKSLKYRDDIRYVGINTGTLGFLQEIEANKIDEFVDALVTGKYKINKVPIEIIFISMNDNDNDFDKESIDEKMYALNEITIKEEKGDTMHVSIYVNETCLEEYSGDGIMISTSTGSTAYNMSYGGAIVDRNIETLQITPMAPLSNKCYSNLLNSVIVGRDSIITIYPTSRQKTGFCFKADGKELVCGNVKSITVELGAHIHVLSLGQRDYIRIINEKLLN